MEAREGWACGGGLEGASEGEQQVNGALRLEQLPLPPGSLGGYRLAALLLLPPALRPVIRVPAMGAQHVLCSRLFVLNTSS